MKNLIIIILLFLTGIVYSQNGILTAAQKDELINYDYSSYINNQKTIIEFLSNVPYVLFTNNDNYDFIRGETVFLRGFEIYFTSNGEEFIINLMVEDLEHIPNERYNPANPWDMNLLKQEKIKYITIQDMGSDEFMGLVKQIGS